MLTVTAPEASLLAAYVALLHRYGGSGDISVGYDGLPVRVEVSGDTTFGELVRRVTVACEEARAHRMPLSALVAGLRPEPARGGGLFFNTGFSTGTGSGTDVVNGFDASFDPGFGPGAGSEAGRPPDRWMWRWRSRCGRRASATARTCSRPRPSTACWATTRPCWPTAWSGRTPASESWSCWTRRNDTGSSSSGTTPATSSRRAPGRRCSPSRSA
ncbi:hypothetical protein ACFQX6_15740 [Streptosporangium lutulentum]